MKDKAIKRKILKDRDFPGPDQINKHQDFGRLRADHALIRKLLMKKIFLGSGALVLAAGISGWLLLNKPAAAAPGAGLENKRATSEKTAIRPPIPGQETPFRIYRISAENGGVFHHPGGSTITVPPHAFYSKNGLAPGDSIEIRYREFHDPLGIFLSGIPMEYDSAGLRRTLESAGMIEIAAFRGKDSLRLDERHPVQIRMASASSEARFNLYGLDKVRQNWLYLGKDRIETPGTTRFPEKTKEERGSPEEADLSLKPALAGRHRYTFSIAYDKKEFPELAAYDKVLFEVTDENFKPAYLNINWNKISVYGGDQPGHYLVKLKKADTSISVSAKPVFDSAGYAEALERFEERHRAAAKERDREEREDQSRLNQANEALSGYNANSMVSLAYKMISLSAYRTFSIRSMGIYNIDFPIPPIVQYAYSFKKATEIKKSRARTMEVAYSTVFLVEKGKNTVFRFAKGELVRCNPNAKNLMWTLTGNNEIAFFRISDYRRLVNGAETGIRPVVSKDQALAFNEIRRFSQ